MDSSAAAIWCQHYLPAVEVTLVYVDLGADHVGFGGFLHEFAEWISMPLQVIRSRHNLIDLFLTQGEWPQYMHPYCHHELHGAVDACLADHGPDSVVMVRGGRREEKSGQSQAMTSRWREIRGYRYFSPLYFADKDTSEAVLQEVGAPVWPGYGAGLCRTACRICPGQRQQTYAIIREKFPDVWAELMMLERRLGFGAWQKPDNKTPTSFSELADRYETRQPGQ